MCEERNNNIQVRHAKIDEVKSISTLSKNQLIEWGINPSHWDTNFLIQQVNKKFVLVAIASGEVVGYTAWVNNALSNRLESGRIHITNTVIKPSYRKQGIAESIRKMVIKYCRLQNINRITTNHHPANQAMHNLSRKLGFLKYKESIIDKNCENDIFFEMILKSET